jgi:hypothetical protein
VPVSPLVDKIINKIIKMKHKIGKRKIKMKRKKGKKKKNQLKGRKLLFT